MKTKTEKNGYNDVYQPYRKDKELKKAWKQLLESINDLDESPHYCILAAESFFKTYVHCIRKHNYRVHYDYERFLEEIKKEHHGKNKNLKLKEIEISSESKLNCIKLLAPSPSKKKIIKKEHLLLLLSIAEGFASYTYSSKNSIINKKEKTYFNLTSKQIYSKKEIHAFTKNELENLKNDKKILFYDFEEMAALTPAKIKQLNQKGYIVIGKNNILNIENDLRLKLSERELLLVNEKDKDILLQKQQAATNFQSMSTILYNLIEYGLTIHGMKGSIFDKGTIDELEKEYNTNFTIPKTYLKYAAEDSHYAKEQALVDWGSEFINKLSQYLTRYPEETIFHSHQPEACKLIEKIIDVMLNERTTSTIERIFTILLYAKQLNARDKGELNDIINDMRNKISLINFNQEEKNIEQGEIITYGNSTYTNDKIEEFRKTFTYKLLNSQYSHSTATLPNKDIEERLKRQFDKVHDQLISEYHSRAPKDFLEKLKAWFLSLLPNYSEKKRKRDTFNAYNNIYANRYQTIENVKKRKLNKDVNRNHNKHKHNKTSERSSSVLT